MLGVAGGMALLLGIVGIYGVIAVSVSQRTREIGIRMALGAQQRSLTGMFVRHGLWLTGIGVVCGLAASFALMRLMSSLLFRVSPADPFSYAASLVRPGRHIVPRKLSGLAARHVGRSRRGVAGRIIHRRA